MFLEIFCKKEKKNVLINIHEYANELIYIFEYQIKGQCLRFSLLPTLSFYVEDWLSYD